MKKISIVLVILFAVISELKGQTISVNAFGGYTFDEKLNFDNAYATIRGGSMWGVSAEGIGPHGGGIELLYQYQSTTAPVSSYSLGQLNPGNDGAVISYLLLNGIQYFKVIPKIEPYAGLGAGAIFISANSGSSATKFAWDFKGGLKIKAKHGLAFKVGAQLLSSLQESGTYYYYYYGHPYAYTGYSTIWQFSFTGGVTFDFGR
jgi:hypothetical protein